MNETDPRTDPRYQQVRDAFAKLETQDKAAFVLEATFDTVGQALRDVGQSVGDVIEKMSSEDFFDDLFRRPAADSETPGATEPPTTGASSSGSRRRTPPPGSRHRTGRLALVDPYPFPLVRIEGPPFKPCVRLSRTRLTGGRSGRGSCAASG